MNSTVHTVHTCACACVCGQCWLPPHSDPGNAVILRPKRVFACICVPTLVLLLPSLGIRVCGRRVSALESLENVCVITFQPNSLLDVRNLVPSFNPLQMVQIMRVSG